MTLPESITLSHMWVRVKYTGGELWHDRFYVQKPEIGKAYAVLKAHEWHAAMRGEFNIVKGYVSP
jgi:hypothetical protein